MGVWSLYFDLLSGYYDQAIQSAVCDKAAADSSESTA